MMTRIGSRSLFAIVVLVGAGALVLSVAPADSQSTGGHNVAFDEYGNIRVPDIDYRKDWSQLGSWAVAESPGAVGSQGIHSVYTQPDSVVAYQKNGKFPDGTVLIKELFSTTTQDMTTGTVSRANQTLGWFVMIKDENDRFPNNQLWGDGWGWAFFDAADRANTTTTDYVGECKACHVPAEANDWVYIEGYPVLVGK